MPRPISAPRTDVLEEDDALAAKVGCDRVEALGHLLRQGGLPVLVALVLRPVRRLEVLTGVHEGASHVVRPARRRHGAAEVVEFAVRGVGPVVAQALLRVHVAGLQVLGFVEEHRHDDRAAAQAQVGARGEGQVELVHAPLVGGGRRVSGRALSEWPARRGPWVQTRASWQARTHPVVTGAPLAHLTAPALTAAHLAVAVAGADDSHAGGRAGGHVLELFSPLASPGQRVLVPARRKRQGEGIRCTKAILAGPWSGGTASVGGCPAGTAAPAPLNPAHLRKSYGRMSIVGMHAGRGDRGGGLSDVAAAGRLAHQQHRSTWPHAPSLL